MSDLNTDSSKPAAKSGNKRLLLGCVALLFVMGCLACGGIGWLVTRANSQFDRGNDALSNGDCVTAVAEFDQVNDSLWATEEYKTIARKRTAVCDRYLQLIDLQEAGDFSVALIGYDDLIEQNSDNPLIATIEQQAKSVFQAEPERVADVAVCQRLDSHLERNWIPDLPVNLPIYYQTCGRLFTETAAYTQAVQMYERFAVAYPDHPDFRAVEQALAKAAVAEAQQAGAGTIAPPQSIGGSGSGAAVVIIQNDSPENMSLIFSGPEAYFETIEPCETCQDYFVAPPFCPEEGPVGTYELPPGTYNVLVKSISDDGVTPFTGTWELKAGEEYYSCFFLIVN